MILGGGVWGGGRGGGFSGVWGMGYGVWGMDGANLFLSCFGWYVVVQIGLVFLLGGRRGDSQDGMNGMEWVNRMAWVNRSFIIVRVTTYISKSPILTSF